MRRPLKLKTDYLNLLLDLAAQRTRERGDRAYERVLGMPLRDVRLLRMIGAQPGIAMGALSDGSGLEKTLASKVVGSLAKRGLLERQIGQKDARNVHLVLTDKGVDVVKRAEPLGKKLEAGFSLLLGKNELDELRNSLQKVLDAELATREQFEVWLQKIADPAAD
ncbi:MAG TPA: MarR family transcriptional regulator [Comamonadaceae bacterium]|nr:MarR family transcriptional regulator [Comamonadaceae bacterium]